MKDLKIPIRQLCTTESDPVYVRPKFEISCFFLFSFSTSWCSFHKPLFPTFALLDITMGQMGNTTYLLF